MHITDYMETDEVHPLLAAAAEQLGKMPQQGEAAGVYEMLAQALKQVENPRVKPPAPENRSINSNISLSIRF